MGKFLAVLMGALGAAAIWGTSGLATWRAYTVGGQLGEWFAVFSAFAMLVIIAAKFFGFACVTFSKSLVLQIAGGTLAAAGAVVTSLSVWWTYYKIIQVPASLAAVLPWSPDVHAAIYAAHIAVAGEIGVVFAWVAPWVWYSEDQRRAPEWLRA